MRTEEEVRGKLAIARDALQDTTSSLSRGLYAGLDLTGMAGTVGIIQALEWVLGDAEELHTGSAGPLKRPIEDI